MICRLLVVLVLLAVPASAYADGGQVIATADGDTVVAARDGHIIKIQAITFIAAADTAVECRLYTTSGDVLGTSAVPIAIDRVGVEGLPGLVMTYNEKGWVHTSGSGEALLVAMNTDTNLIIVITYEYVKG